MANRLKPPSRKIVTPLDDQLDDSFPASDPPSLTDPSRTIVPTPPVPEHGEAPAPKPPGGNPQDP